MIRRCYEQTHMYYYLYGGNGVTVCKRWHCFENFVADLPYIDGYDDEMFHNKELHLDKDLKQKGVGFKVYSLETCTFLPKNINGKISYGIPCLAINIDNSNVIYAESIKDMSMIIGVDPAYVRRTMYDNKLCRGYKLCIIPAQIIPATICKKY